MKVSVALLLASMATFARADEGVDILNPARVSGLVTIQNNLDAVAAAIMKCMQGGREHNVCVCEHRELISRFNASVRDVFRDHPGLGEYDLVRFKSPDGIRTSQSLKSLRKQASTPLSCN